MAWQERKAEDEINGSPPKRLFVSQMASVTPRMQRKMLWFFSAMR